MLRLLFCLSCCFAMVTCLQAETTLSVGADLAFPKLKLKKPLALVWLPGEGDRRWAVEQDGTVRLVVGADPSEAPLALDLRGVVLTEGREEGLLHLAIHPDFANNGRVFVWCCVPGPRRNQLIEFRADPASGIIDPATSSVLLSIDDPANNHNGGTLVFGPDAKLYVSTGDGGAGGDPWGNGQNLGVLLGKVLRLDVDGKKPYAIPADNPFVDVRGARGEIWAYGLRNVWRMSFDRETGVLWGGDVGQNKVEEIDRIERGGNHGWNLREGKLDFKMKDNPGDLVEPVIDYPRNLGISVTGGYVYRGTAIPALVGWYVYGDFQTGRVWALRESADGSVENQELFAEPRRNISSFAEAPDGELYYTAFDGRIYRLVGK
jgi:glucose/arabinose dehydrogenase